MPRWWTRSAFVLAAALAPIAGAASLTQGCGSTTVTDDAGADGDTDGDAGAGPVTTVLHPDAAPLPGETTCEVTITTNIPVSKAIHVPICTHVDYPTNPPSGGNHWGVWAAFTSYDVPVPREMYVHDLEHGALVLLHKCDGCTEEAVAALQKARDAVAGDPLCLQIPDGSTERVVITPDPLIETSIAAAAWGATYTATCLDEDSLRDFAQKHYGHGTESLCAQGVTYGAADGGSVFDCDDAGTGGDAAAGGGGAGGTGAGGGTGGNPDAG